MTTSPTAAHLESAIKTSGLTQREIAHRAGFPKANVLSMMKRGETKVPIERIPALSEACDTNARTFITIAMREYHPEMWKVLEGTFEPRLSKRDRDVLKILRVADPDNEIEIWKEDAAILIALFKYMISWLRIYRHWGKATIRPNRKA